MQNKHTYHSGTIKSLYAHSGNVCAYPGCNQELVCNEDINISEICHIYGLNTNSARFVEGFAQEYLNSEENLILLCPTHHAMVDAIGNANMFPVQTLLNMKVAHEADVKAKLSGALISYNENIYVCDYSKIKKKLFSKYGIEIEKKEIENIGTVFSSQNMNVRIVMKKILDIMHRNREYEKFHESGTVNMLTTLSELNVEISSLAIIVQYLETLGMIHEMTYEKGNINSYLENENGELIDISENYIFKIQRGSWCVTDKGLVLDAIYCEQMYI